MSPRLRQCAWLLVFALAYVFTPALFELDDAYISLHSARALLSGGDTVFGSPALTGVTSPPYVGLIAVLLAGGFPALRIATAAGLTAFTLSLWMLGSALYLSPARRLILVAVTLGSGYTLVNATNGLETGWALATSTALIVFAYRGQHLAAGAAAGLLPLLRPDLAPASALVLAWALWNRSWGERAQTIAVAAAIVVPTLLWVRLDTGAWLPRTMEAKRLWFSEACRPFPFRARLAAVALGEAALQLAVPVTGLVMLWRDPMGRVGLAAAGASLTAYLFLLPGGLAHNHYRYTYAILLPWAAYGMARAMGYRAESRAITARLALLALLVPVAGRWTSDPDIGAEMIAASRWLDASLGSDAVVLVHDAGTPSELARSRLVDIVGLKTPGSIAVHARVTGPTCGAGRPQAIAEIARSSAASHFMVLKEWDAIFKMTDGLRQEGFSLTPLRESGRIERGYTVFRLERNTQSGTIRSR